MDAGLQAKQHDILDSIRSERDVKARRRRWQEMKVERAVEEAEILDYMNEVEEEELEPSYAVVYLTPGTDVVGISDNDS
ncbi:hypothetical protein D1007_28270 [Hordeum vulgare]|nr:hypothetical protein D1007_28270 [Hordeum vulgare]